MSLIGEKIGGRRYEEETIDDKKLAISLCITAVMGTMAVMPALAASKQNVYVITKVKITDDIYG